MKVPAFYLQRIDVQVRYLNFPCLDAIGGRSRCPVRQARKIAGRLYVVATLDAGKPVLVVGAGGTAGEIYAAARLEPEWSFLDPSPPMLDLARTHLIEADVFDRVETVPGAVADLDSSPSFDAVIMIGVAPSAG